MSSDNDNDKKSDKAGKAKGADASQEKTVISSEDSFHEDITDIIHGGAVDTAETVMATKMSSADAPGDDATVMADFQPDDDATQMANFEPDAEATVTQDPGSISQITDASWGKGSKSTYVPSDGERVINGRFVLDKLLGRGGMGVVYRAKDIRKVEAQDRNPWVAIKILGDEFKEHPEAFMSLQREARKTQNLAHPNIVRVYDFDRDQDEVYMTMELLEGSDLDIVIKKNKEGLGYDRAIDVIRDCGMALSEAHAQNIVHSDFKPGNIFYTKDSRCKVFDFGIARAAADIDMDDDDGEGGGDKTLFDAGNLGALTPAYASNEMLNRKEPTKSDDVYALGCVAYEAFTGRHPYNKKRADKCLADGDKLEKIPGLTRREMKALSKALALDGKDRYSTVDDFMADFFPEKKKLTVGVIISFVILALIIGAGAINYYAEEDNKRQRELEISMQEQEIADQKKMQELLAYVQDELDSLQTKVIRSKNTLDQNLFPSYFSRDIAWITRTNDDINALLDIYKDSRLIEDLEAKYTNGKYKDVIIETTVKKTASSSSVDEWASAYKQRVANTFLELVEDDIMNNEFDNASAALDIARQYDGTNKRIPELQKTLFQTVMNVKAEGERERAALAEERHLARMANLEASYKTGKASVARNVKSCQETLEGKRFVKSFTYDMKKLNNKITALKNKYPDLASGIDRDTNAHMKTLGRCIQMFGYSNPDAAKIKVKEAQKIFPRHATMFGKLTIVPFDACKKSFAGKGKRYKCGDRFYRGGGSKGPNLVVIPKNGSEPMFAISKFEISEQEFNMFCSETDKCEVSPADDNLPVVNRSAQDINAYLEWLSYETGFEYQLPTISQWKHAATASGSALDTDRNCSLDVRGVIKGVKLLPVSNGKPNDWGLVNHVGNASEVVTSGSSLKAVGGSRLDDMELCTFDTQSGFTGASEVTGFRVLRVVH